MTTTTIALLFLVRVLIPFTLLLVLGEWVRRRELRYWLRD